MNDGVTSSKLLHRNKSIQMLNKQQKKLRGFTMCEFAFMMR